MIRKLLTQSHVSPSDRRAQFVGAEAYEAAGGIIFAISSSKTTAATTPTANSSTAWCSRSSRTPARAVWGRLERVAVYPEYPYNFVHALRRIYPHSVPLSEEESAKLDELVTRHDALDRARRGAS